MLNVLFKDDHDEWVESVRVIPELQHRVILDRAPTGVVHRVARIEHRIGGRDHRIVVMLLREIVAAP